MPRSFRGLQEITRRLVEAVTTAVRHTPEGRFGETVRASGRKLSEKDSEISREFLKGTNMSDGGQRSFEAHQVDSVALADSNGNVIGVQFPIQKDDTDFGDADFTVKWARAEHRSSDEYYLSTSPSSVKTSGATEIEETPWRKADGQPPTYVMAHGSLSGATAVRIRSSSGELSDVRVDGPTFGRILVANDHYRRALEETSGTTVHASCYGSSAAKGMAAELWKSGIDTEVYAFKPIVGLGLNADLGLSGIDLRTKGPDEAALLNDPITHYVPPARKVDDST